MAAWTESEFRTPDLTITNANQTTVKFKLEYYSFLQSLQM
jgi:hypothetical protein